jgi:hypothetical protein
MTALLFVLIVLAVLAVTLRALQRTVTGLLTGLALLAVLLAAAVVHEPAVPASRSPAEAWAAEDAPAPLAKEAEVQAEKPLEATATPSDHEPVLAEPVGVVIPPRPASAAWVDSAPVRDGDVHTTAVCSGPFETQQECRVALDRGLQQAVAEYIDWYLRVNASGRIQPSTRVHYEVAEIRRDLVRPQNIYTEQVHVSVGPMVQMHALLEFDQAFRQDLDHRWQECVALGRMRGVGLAFGVVVALLATFFGYTKADTATRGYYTGRLRLTAVAVILTVIVAGSILALAVLL